MNQMNILIAIVVSIYQFRSCISGTRIFGANHIFNVNYAIIKQLTELINIGIKTDTHSVSKTGGTVKLQLWFDSTIYQCILYPTAINTEYSCDASEITTIESDCDDDRMMLLIDNSGSTDGVVIENIFVTTADSVFYGVEGICIDDLAFKGEWYSNIKVDDTNCDAGYTHYSAICVDNEVSGSGSCGPGKQLIYFDTNNTNGYITNAVWEDGSNFETDISLCGSNHEILNIGITTDTYDVSGSSGTVNLNLWFGSIIYQCILYPTAADTVYSCDSSQITKVGTNCDDHDMMVLIDNSGSTDGVVIQNIFVTTPDGILYGVDGVCIEDALFKGEWYGNVKMTDSICSSGYTHYSAVCVDNEASGSGSCGPGKQVIYLDPNRPNNYITDALWDDGSNVVMDETLCESINGTDCRECVCDCDIAYVSLCMDDNSVYTTHAAMSNSDEQITGNLRIVQRDDKQATEIFILYGIIIGLISVIVLLIGFFVFYVRSMRKFVLNDNEQTVTAPILHSTLNGSDTDTL